MAKKQATEFSVRDERRPGHFWADNELFDVYAPKIGAYAFAVYMALARFANNRTGRSIISVVRIAQALGISAATVKRSTKLLREHSLIEVEHREGPSSYLILEVAKGSSNRAMAPAELEVAPIEPGDSSEGATNKTNNNTQDKTQLGKPTRREKTAKPLAMKIYGLSWRKDNKMKGIEKTTNAIIEIADRADIMTLAESEGIGAMLFAARWLAKRVIRQGQVFKDTQQQLVPMLATWMFQKRYDDPVLEGIGPSSSAPLVNGLDEVRRQRAEQ